MSKEFKIKSLDNDFRIVEMNAIEALALRSQVDFDSFETSLTFFNQVLERIEVRCDDKWLRVKEKNRAIYFPADIENNVLAVNDLIDYFLNEYFKPLFRKSDASKS